MPIALDLGGGSEHSKSEGYQDRSEDQSSNRANISQKQSKARASRPPMKGIINDAKRVVVIANDVGIRELYISSMPEDLLLLCAQHCI